MEKLTAHIAPFSRSIESESASHERRRSRGSYACSIANEMTGVTLASGVAIAVAISESRRA
jgi:hypothetical protein